MAKLFVVFAILAVTTATGEWIAKKFQVFKLHFIKMYMKIKCLSYILKVFMKISK